MSNKMYIIMMMIVVSIAGFSMPATFAFGSGQHRFEQIDPENPNVFCMKCHNNDQITEELNNSQIGAYTNIKVHSSLTCVSCHRMNTWYGQATLGQKQQHAAKKVTCIECHTLQGRFDAGFLGDVSDELANPEEAHHDFSNEDACVGCHTGVSISGSVSYTYSGGSVQHGLKIGR